MSHRKQSVNEHVKDKVLIVDDTKTIVHVLSMILEKENIEVFTASSGEAALELLKTVSVHTILMDIQMGKGIDGFETCKLIKAQARIKDVPVIFLTAFDDMESKMKGFAAGGIDFVSKSFDKNEIITRVKNQTTLFKMQESMQRGFAYIRAILDAEKQMVAIFDENYKLENHNKSFAQKFDLSHEQVLRENLSQYDHYKIPPTDKEFLQFLSEYSDFKAEIKGQFGIFSFELTETEVLNEAKHILTITDITVYEVVKKQEIELFKFKEKYHNVQQQDAFKKQKKIIKDQVSHLAKDGWLFDSYYKPLDILSGDTFGTIKINDQRYLFYIVDAMGKGLSASVTSIQSTSFINNSIEKAAENDDFDLETIVESFNAFIRKQLLEDELLCALFLDFDLEKNSISIINYGMPPVLLEQELEIKSIRPNNPPIMAFFSTCNMDVVDLKDITKIALYSDGLNESEQDDKSPFGKHIEEDFAEASLLRRFLRTFYSKVKILEDDLTLIFIAKESNKKTLFEKNIEITSKLSQIAVANEEVERFMEEVSITDKDAGETTLIFNELLMNAFEHGSLNISSSQKDKMIEDGSYDEFLEELEGKSEAKPIKIEMRLDNLKGKDNVLKISIEDAGSGFGFSETLKTIYLDKDAKFSGRGVWMAKDLTDGVYFNELGNKTTFFKTVSLKT